MSTNPYITTNEDLIIKEPGHIPTKAYILRIQNPLSLERGANCAKSCENVGLPYEYFEGYQGIKGKKLWDKLELNMKVSWGHAVGAECCYAGHIEIWKKIRDNKECAIVLEHDFYMRYPVNLEIPDGVICNLGYKVVDKDDYDHVTAGPPQHVRKIIQFSGSHAYAITWKTADMLIKELENHGLRCDIDTAMFLRWQCKGREWGFHDPPPKINSGIPLAVVEPSAGVCWTVDEKSTIRYGTGVHNIYPLPSFAKFWNKRTGKLQPIPPKK
jgi:GR25 family glycosyltransferase involved in LPS biosynthesis